MVGENVSTIFPDGENGLKEEREVKIRIQQWFEQKLLNYDERFADSASFLYAATQLLEKEHLQKNLNYQDLIRSCDIGLSTVIINKKLFLENKFSSNKTKEDYSLWLKISKKNKIFGLNKNLMLWRKTSNSLSSSFTQKIYDAFDIYYNQEKFNIVSSFFKVFILSIHFLKKNNK